MRLIKEKWPREDFLSAACDHEFQDGSFQVVNH